MSADPVSGGGPAAIRYAVSTGPALALMPPSLILPLGVWFGHLDAGGEIGFSGAVVLPLAAEYLRRASLTLASPAARRGCVSALAAIFAVTPVLSVVALLLGLYLVNGGVGRASGGVEQPILVVGLVLSVLAVLAGLALSSFLRGPVWARQKAAAVRGPGVLGD